MRHLPGRFLRLLLLGLLLVFAPEIHTFASSALPRLPSKAVPLRVVLCADERIIQEALTETLHLYMNEYPDIHLRIFRANAERLFSENASQADVYILPADQASKKHASLSFDSSMQTPFICLANPKSCYPQAAGAFIDCFRAALPDENAP